MQGNLQKVITIHLSERGSGGGINALLFLQKAKHESLRPWPRKASQEEKRQWRNKQRETNSVSRSIAPPPIRPENEPSPSALVGMTLEIPASHLLSCLGHQQCRFASTANRRIVSPNSVGYFRQKLFNGPLLVT
ncbi:hypothetical protein TorRG33x02_124080 [Trema orientale]|uniref:Uncharacterized protein n=1 Tax=Trema orientale TaxID=63057 RepID=A0A2P5F1Z1_TREOI|nr:hypothetical protein TorRG33x02_124080 [Trema orientale]